MKLVLAVLFTTACFWHANAYAEDVVTKDDACLKNRTSSLCISTRRAELNLEIKAILEADPSAIFSMLKASGLAPNTLLACRVFVSRPEFQKGTVISELTQMERDTLVDARVENFEMTKTGNLRCEYLGRKVVGAPGRYVLGEQESFERKGSISNCLPEITRRANQNGLEILRQTREMVSFKFPEIGSDVSEGSFGCSWLKPQINLAAAYKSCKPPSSFYQNIATLMQVPPKSLRAIANHLQNCALRAERDNTSYFTRRYGYEATCTFSSGRGPRRDCEVGISVFSSAQ